MQYAILIYPDPSAFPTDLDQVAHRQAWMDLTQEMIAAGVLRAGEALQPVDTATTLRRRNGEIVSTDGPFAETKEILGGFYVIDVANLDEALTWAGRMPNLDWAAIEVRPVLQLS